MKKYNILQWQKKNFKVSKHLLFFICYSVSIVTALKNDTNLIFHPSSTVLCSLFPLSSPLRLPGDELVDTRHLRRQWKISQPNSEHTDCHLKIKWRGLNSTCSNPVLSPQWSPDCIHYRGAVPLQTHKRSRDISDDNGSGLNSPTRHPFNHWLTDGLPKRGKALIVM